MILLIDNYDSFVYNLYQFIAEIEPDVKVVRNDEITSEEILKMNPDKIVISPGPGKPSEAGECIHVIRELKGKIPILGSVPGTSGNRRSIWSNRRICKASDAWKNVTP